MTQRQAAFYILVTTLTLLIFETTLTRIFSVVMNFHMAFLALSIALFGMSFGSILVSVFDGWFSRLSLTKAVGILVRLQGLAFMSIIPLLALPIVNFYKDGEWVPRLRYLMGLFFLPSLPFILGGMILSLIFHRMGKMAGKLYFADLAGASLGCLLVIPAISFMGAISTLIFLAAAVWVAVALVEERHFEEPTLPPLIGKRVGYGLAGLLALNVLTNVLSIQHQQISTASANILFSRWNSFSRIAVYEGNTFTCWGYPPNLDKPEFEELGLDTDGMAYAPLIKYNGKPEEFASLQYDIPSLVYPLANPDSALVLGLGGGKDILTAIAAGVDRIVGVELNPILVDDVMLDEFAEYSGRIYEHPNVEVHVDNGRSFVARTDETFDVVQLAMVDTQAGSSKGAFILAENHLYSTEAFSDYFERLNEGGMLSIAGATMHEINIYRRIVPALVAALERLGHETPERHFLICDYPAHFNQGCLILASKNPLSEATIDAYHTMVEQTGFRMIYTPRQALAGHGAAEYLTAADRAQFVREAELNHTPFTDDQPFLFYMLRFRHFVQYSLFPPSPAESAYAGFFLMLRSFIVCLIIVAVLLFAPLVWQQREALQEKPDKVFGILLYTACLGAGFMFVEIHFLQKFFLLLGKPLYSLAVILFTLLLFGGLGSFLTQRIADEKIIWWLRAILPGILVVALVGTFLWPYYKSFGMGMGDMARIFLTVTFVAPLGFILGMPFPLMIRYASAQGLSIAPWMWGMNGFMGVIGSALSTFLSLNFGITFTVFCGIACYGLALFVVMRFHERDGAAAATELC